MFFYCRRGDHFAPHSSADVCIILFPKNFHGYDLGGLLLSRRGTDWTRSNMWRRCSGAALALLRRCGMAVSRPLHVGVVWTAAALGHGPVDVLRRVLDVARFAVDTVLGVDLEARIGPSFVVEDLVDTGGTLEPSRFREAREVHVDRHTGVAQSQVDRLILRMVGRRKEDAGEHIRRGAETAGSLATVALRLDGGGFQAGQQRTVRRDVDETVGPANEDPFGLSG